MNTTNTSKISQLTIRHNHGIYVMKDVELVPYDDKGCRKAIGTVVKGNVTSRLGAYSSTQKLTADETMEVDIWNRQIHQEHNQPVGHCSVNIEFF